MRSGAPEEQERALVLRAGAGDQQAFEQLYRAHAPRIYALCLRLAGDPQRAAELTQDVFVRAWEAIGGFRGDAALASWLHRLAVNAHLMLLRSDHRRTQRVALADDLDDGADVGHRGVLRMERGRAARPDVEGEIDLERAIVRLPPGARTVFVLHEIEGYSHDEIAAATGLAASTVRVHLHRARRLLLEMLS